MGWLSKPKAQGPTAAERAEASSAAHKFNDYQQRFVPLENSFISEIQTSDADRASLRGQNTADVAQALAGQDQNLVRSSASGLASGKSVMARAGLAGAGAEAGGEARSNADATLRMREQTGLLKMAGFGRDLADTNSITLGKLAGTQNADSIDRLRSKTERMGQNFQAVGNFVGTTLSNLDNMDKLKTRFG